MTDRATTGDDSADRETYGLLDELDRLEELLEEMDALGVSSRADVERRLTELNARIDDRAGG